TAGSAAALRVRVAFDDRIGLRTFLALYWPQGCLFLLVLAATAFLARRAIRAISDPIRQVTEQSRKIAEGAYAAVELNTDFAEFAHLGVSMNRMVSVIAERTEKLQASEESYRNQFLKNVTPMLLVTRDIGEILEANAAAAHYYGRARHQLKTMRLEQLDAPETPASRVLRASVSPPASQGLRSEGKQRRAHGEICDVELSVSAIRFQELDLLHLIIVDVTERNAATAAANRHAAAAQQANEAKSEFLANMSHEIRTPLNGVLGMLDLLLSGRLGSSERRYAEIAQRSGSTLLGLINDILDLSKIEANKLTLESVGFDLMELMDQVGAILGARAVGKNLEVICAILPDTPRLLRGDPTRLRQVLLNLGGNAVKFAATGEVVIRAELQKKDGAGVEFRFSIRDTGPGIPEQKQHLLFQKFSQVDSSTTRQHGGTGLGLAISRQLVELMGGQIGLHSTPGVGTEFWFSLTLEQQPNDPAGTDLTPLAGLRALVVDDNETNRQLLTSWLGSWQMRPNAVGSAADAFVAIRQARAEGDPYAVALLDLSMPGMDGMQLAARIRNDTPDTATKLVLVSSVENMRDQAALTQAGFSDGLPKPVSPKELRKVLLQTLVIAAPPVRPDPAPARTQHRVLLVEDGEINQLVARGMLDAMGYTTDIAGNGAEALRVLAERDYDLVLMDVQMPVMDGREATRQIRQPGSAVRNRAIPVIAMTSYAMTEELDRCLEAGMNAHLTKPITRDGLHAMLQRFAPAATTTAPA
ncbi:MAG: hypothetical protein QG602_3909, partial [Verrucomicrobiota bacterium]|nr:hypothetical protein [Verrucomicrobiota bacterium]